MRKGINKVYNDGYDEMSENEEKKEKTGLIELENLIDLVHLIVQTPFHGVSYSKIGDQHYYFVISGGIPGFARIIYFYRQNEAIKEKYIIHNSLEDVIAFGDQLERRGGVNILPIIHIKNQNIIQIEDIEF